MQTDQPTLFDRLPLERNTVITGKRHTSREAAAKALQTSGTKRAQIWRLIAQHNGLTADEIQQMTNISPNTINPTIRGLVKDEWLTDSFQVRQTRTGCDAIVWVVQP